MRLKWSPLAVKDAIGKVSEHTSRAIAPLEAAEREVDKALEIRNLPGYMEYQLQNLKGRLKMERLGVTGAMERVLNALPKEGLTSEERLREMGQTQPLPEKGE